MVVDKIFKMADALADPDAFEWPKWAACNRYLSLMEFEPKARWLARVSSRPGAGQFGAVAMETFKLSEKYEASYTPRKVEKGWLSEGEIWKRANGVRTGITFRVRGTTEANARKNAEQEALRVCPKD